LAVNSSIAAKSGVVRGRRFRWGMRPSAYEIVSAITHLHAGSGPR
jgi:hypothetical protein